MFVIEKPINFTLNAKIIGVIRDGVYELIPEKFESISTISETIIFSFMEELDETETLALSDYYDQIPQITIQSTPIIQIKIIEAIKYGQNLIVEFAAENVMSGITQAGKTKDVADYLQDVTRYLQTGSLYEVINEIDRLIQYGVPLELEPFVTVDKLNDFKQKVVGFLS